MSIRKAYLVIVFLYFFCVSGLLPSIGSGSQPGLVYQDRGNRYEGVRGEPVSSSSIAIISATVDYTEVMQQLPAEFKLKFYLRETAPVFITVRELYNNHNYWLDKIKPSKGWRTGFDNAFEWPTAEVIKHLNGLQLYSLGVLAQLNSDTPSQDVQVAPCLLFSSKLPKKIEGYLFTFKVGRKADITCSFSMDKGGVPILNTEPFQGVNANRPRTVRWSSLGAADGWYKLVITASFANNGEEITKTVHFYHHALVD